MSIIAAPLTNGFGPMPRLGDVLRKDVTYNVDEDEMSQGVVLNTGDNGAIDGSFAAARGLRQGTYRGTQLALTAFYSLIEEAAVSHFEVQGFQPIITQKRDLTLKKHVYRWSSPSEDGFPPHLLAVPLEQADGAPAVGSIFDHRTLEFVQQVAQAVSFIIPEDITREGTPFEGPTLAECEEYNQKHPSPRTDIMNGENIGNKADWYSDARFAQQYLSGVNPSTIERANIGKIEEYAAEASKQGLDAMTRILLEGDDLFIQDYSYFRKATGVSNDEDFRNAVPELNSANPTDNMTFRYACAPVVMLKLHLDGRLHPLAITLDYKGSLGNSVTIFNRRLTPDGKSDIEEKDDWAWSYAKTCAQTADWSQHEMATHLVDTHMIEEAIIVATNRTVPEDHILYETLSPHWFRTLALNQAAREVLVPYVIARLAGFGPSITPRSSRTMKLIDWSYKNFDFQSKYIPTNLEKRGFNIEALAEEQYRNYPYATDMYLLWGVTHDFVRSMLGTRYKSDGNVQNDSYIVDWCKEIQTAGHIPTFPTIATVDELVNAVTMCIHTASSQHTAVNYLQDYYYSFVPAKPPALCTPLPKDLATLQKYTEADLTAALPIGSEGVKWKDWLLAAQLPELLSYKVDSRYNLLTYVKSLYNVNKSRTNAENKEWDSHTIKKAAALFYSRLRELDSVFKHVSDRQTEGTIEYKVLQPEVTAVPILI